MIISLLAWRYVIKIILIQLNNAARGSLYDIDGINSCIIGRGPDSDIQVLDDMISTKHAQIALENNHMILTDLASRNGTFVNGTKIAKKQLKRGDSITIGTTVFRVKSSSIDSEASENTDSFFTDTQVIKSPSPVPNDHLFTSPELVECMQSMQEIMDKYTDDLVRDCLKIIFRVLPATRISIFTIKKNGELTQSYTIVQNRDVPTEHMSRSFAQRILSHGDALLIENVAESPEDMETTLLLQQVRSIIGVPITIQGKQKAVILCDNLHEPAVFNKSHLRVMKFFSRVFEILYQRDAIYKLDNLESFLPICASCKKIRDDNGYWKQLESYISQRADVRFSHSICPECADKAMAELKS